MIESRASAGRWHVGARMDLNQSLYWFFTARALFLHAYYEDEAPDDASALGFASLRVAFDRDGRHIRPLVDKEDPSEHLRSALANGHLMAGTTATSGKRYAFHSLANKTLRLAMALHSGREHEIPVGERRTVIRLLKRAASRIQASPGTMNPNASGTRVTELLEVFAQRLLDADWPAAPQVHQAPPGMVAFSYAWHPAGNNGRGALNLARATSFAPLTAIDADSAPVAFELRTPGEPLMLRRHESGYLRPILVPNAWRPATVAEFAMASGSGEAWIDSPWTVPYRPDETALSLDEVCFPVRFPNRADLDRMEAAALAAQEQAGPLLVIDGIVHRRCSRPKLNLAFTSSKRGTKDGVGPELSLRWNVGNLTSTDDQHTFRIPTTPRHEHSLDVRTQVIDFEPDDHDALAAALEAARPELNRLSREEGISRRVDAAPCILANEEGIMPSSERLMAAARILVDPRQDSALEGVDLPSFPFGTIKEVEAECRKASVAMRTVAHPVTKVNLTLAQAIAVEAQFLHDEEAERDRDVALRFGL